jgi:hypothetical protein
VISHGGGINGFNTLEMLYIGDHDLIVIFNNTPGANLGEISKNIRAILYGQVPAPPKRPLVYDLGKTISNHGIDAAIAQYRDLKHTRASDYDFNGGTLNRLGYMLLAKSRNSDAIAIFK